MQHTIDVRSDLAVTVTRAERRYPDDPKGTWGIDGLRVDTPEESGSFWETLRRAKS